MWAIIDVDHQPLERWHDMHAAETVVVWDAHIGGFPVAMLGIEFRLFPDAALFPVMDPLSGRLEHCFRSQPRKQREPSTRQVVTAPWS